MEIALHQIQLQILTLLMQSADNQRYSELMLPDVENDLFNYHLQNLVSKGFVSKTGSSYELTEKGKKEITKLDALGNPTYYFKVSVALAVFRNDYAELLVQRRARKPFFGDVTSIAGKVQPGEKIIDTARRKLMEEANLASIFTFVGVLRKIKRNEHKEILEDVFYHYCIAHEPVGVLNEKNTYGENFWIPSKEILHFEKKNVDVAEYDIAVWNRLLNKDLSPFYFEQDSIINGY